MILLKNGKIQTITNGIIENGEVLIEDGKIKAIGNNLEAPKDAEIIDVNGMWVMPGLIDCHTHISMMGEPSMAPGPSADGNEMTDPITPHMRTLDALDPNDISIVPVRNAGFTTVFTGPGSGNIIGGTGLCLKLRGETADEMAIPNSEQMKMALGENPKRMYGGTKKAPMTRMATAAILRNTLRDAKEYADKLEKANKEGTNPPAYNAKMEALVKVVRKEQRVKIHCHRADDIATAIRIAEEFDLDYTIEHATEGYKIVNTLKKHNVTCVVGPFMMAPSKQELWNFSMENAGILSNAGITICLTADASIKTEWLPCQVGLLIKRGLSVEDAFKAVTINPAKVLGLDDRIGSLEVGKDADIAVFDEFPFSNMAMCKLTMIDGVIYHNTL